MRKLLEVFVKQNYNNRERVKKREGVLVTAVGDCGLYCLASVPPDGPYAHAGWHISMAACKIHLKPPLNAQCSALFMTCNNLQSCRTICILQQHKTLRKCSTCLIFSQENLLEVFFFFGNKKKNSIDFSSTFCNIDGKIVQIDLLPVPFLGWIDPYDLWGAGKIEPQQIICTASGLCRSTSERLRLITVVRN